MDAIKYAYKNKGFDGEIYHPIVKATGIQLSDGVNKGYGILKETDFDSPDYVMRQYLKRNIWKFSVAKNYNDCIRLSNLLLREDGSLRPWNEFKREAERVVGDSNRYLKTEYDTIVAGAQMSRLWQEIQRDKHIFPYVQFDVVMDKRTSDICEPLNKLIFEVDDPVLAYYFPPNHFNCRTTVRKLRNGVPSTNYKLPDIPEAFKNNTGISGEIFTDNNRYIENTPQELFDSLHYTKDENIFVGTPAKKFSKSEREMERIENEYKDRISTAKILQNDSQDSVFVLPELRSKHWAYQYHFDGANHNKVPDFKINGEFWEMESYENDFSFKKLNKMLKNGYEQADNIIIKLNHSVKPESLEYHLKNRYKSDAKNIIFVEDGKIIYRYKKE